MPPRPFLGWHSFATRLGHVCPSDVRSLMPSSFHGATLAASRATALSTAVDAKTNTESFVLRLSRQDDRETIRVPIVQLSQLSELFGEFLLQV